MPSDRPRPPSHTALRRAPAYLQGLDDEDDPQAEEFCDFPPGADRLVRVARRAQGTSEPRKHHLVPRSYLERWSQSDRIRVTEACSRRTYVTSPKKAARETDFYRFASPDFDGDEVPPLVIETLLSEIEGRAVEGFDALLEGRHPSEFPESALFVAWFLALQLTRGRAFRAELQEMLHQTLLLQHPPSLAAARHLIDSAGMEETEEAVQEVLESIKALHSGEMRVMHQRAALAGMAVQHAARLVPQVLFREWQVYWTAFEPLITCDEPVLVLEGPDSSRRQRGGVGTADVIVAPLSPDAVLALFHPEVELHAACRVPVLDGKEVEDLNRELAANSHKLLFSRPDDKSTLSIPLPPLQPAFLKDGPLPLIGAEPGAEVHRFFKPSRWFSAPNPPALPVARWWWQPDLPSGCLT